MPVRGEYRHLFKHGQLARECGVKPDNVVLLEDGCPLTLLPDGIRLEPPVPVECTLVDGKGVGDVGSAVLRERRILGDEGLVIVVLVLDAETGSVLHGPEMFSKGFVFEQHYSHVLEDPKCLVLEQRSNPSAPGSSPVCRKASGPRCDAFSRRVLDQNRWSAPSVRRGVTLLSLFTGMNRVVVPPRPCFTFFYMMRKGGYVDRGQVFLTIMLVFCVRSSGKTVRLDHSDVST